MIVKIDQIRIDQTYFHKTIMFPAFEICSWIINTHVLIINFPHTKKKVGDHNSSVTKLGEEMDVMKLQTSNGTFKRSEAFLIAFDEGEPHITFTPHSTWTNSLSVFYFLPRRNPEAANAQIDMKKTVLLTN